MTQASATSSSPKPFTASETGRPRWTEALLYAAAAAVFFDPDDRYELINGELILMAPPDPVHDAAVRKVMRVLRAAIQEREDLEGETGFPASLGEHDVPVPDIKIVRIDEGEYESGHPGANDIYLVVEVANSHPNRDSPSETLHERKKKKQRYATFGITDYWVVDLKKSELVIHRDPNPKKGDYDSVQVWKDNQIALATLPDINVDTATLLRKIFRTV